MEALRFGHRCFGVGLPSEHGDPIATALEHSHFEQISETLPVMLEVFLVLRQRQIRIISEPVFRVQAIDPCLVKLCVVVDNEAFPHLPEHVAHGTHVLQALLVAVNGNGGAHQTDPELFFTVLSEQLLGDKISGEIVEYDRVVPHGRIVPVEVLRKAPLEPGEAQRHNQKDEVQDTQPIPHHLRIQLDCRGNLLGVGLECCLGVHCRSGDVELRMPRGKARQRQQ
mmetsp:Transcript_96285/g.272176  ORF Transcript_96285/g.272176 Transcript_96285/m.272176 type:complete len:225 (+) Transcript_96285:1386-2060(+)